MNQSTETGFKQKSIVFLQNIFLVDLESRLPIVRHFLIYEEINIALIIFIHSPFI